MSKSWPIGLLFVRYMYIYINVQMQCFVQCTLTDALTHDHESSIHWNIMDAEFI